MYTSLIHPVKRMKAHCLTPDGSFLQLELLFDHLLKAVFEGPENKSVIYFVLD